jgi:superfamily II RNA helicase
VAHAWCTGASVEEIASRVELGEGDIVSVLNKTVDLLDQFEGMLVQYSDAHLLTVVAEAKRLLVRGLVAMVRSGDRVAEPIPA